MLGLYFLIFAVLMMIFAYRKAPLWMPSITTFLLTADYLFSTNAHIYTVFMILTPLALTLMLFNIVPIRRMLVTQPIFKLFRHLLPELSSTERIAIDAGDTFWEKELMSGCPNFNKLHDLPKPVLSPEEKAFVEGPVTELCNQLDDWEITHDLQDLPAAVWEHLKANGYFGLIIPKNYGGKDFSAFAHSEIIARIAAKSVSAAVTVSVPNSLGPSELLIKYGTQTQKDYYLPRLARGEEIPCFALTSPQAGSDAGSIPDYGIVTKGIFEGKEVLGMRLFWDKRYITLAPVATLLGLAFKLYDPDHLLGEQTDYGITCALIPTHIEGVKIGRRHYPLNICFQNGPTQGHDVFVPLDYIIGGAAMAGHGWRMLMDCLSAGRAISLPSISSGPMAALSCGVGAYARIREQFHLPIGYFEGVEEALARVGAFSYLCEATRVMTAGAIDLGIKPAIAGAISKYHVTELARQSSCNVMDIVGGKGICMGPRNFIARFYQAMPIAITVEGANILTRSMIIFGQGALRCHPYALTEMRAVHDPDKKAGLATFDQAFWGHAGFIMSNFVRAGALALSSGLIFQPSAPPPVKRYYQHMMRLSAALAFTTDIAMALLGKDLKRREKLSARLGDTLSYLYLTSAALKRFHDQGEHVLDLPLVHWACRYSLHQAELALHRFFRNFPIRWVANTMHALIFPFGRRVEAPDDKIGHKIARLLMQPNDARTRLAESTHPFGREGDSVYHKLEETLRACLETEGIEKKIRHAVKSGLLPEETFESIGKLALQAHIINEVELEQLTKAQALRMEVIAVDDFPGNTTLTKKSLV